MYLIVTYMQDCVVDLFC